jgi:DNA-binding transcriptional MerR regulator
VTGYRISEVAERTGLPASTLRYYEDIGVLPAPDRTSTGYRVYDDRTLARLDFVAGAKQLGLTLDEVRALVTLWEADECAPVQQEMARLVDAKLAEVARRSKELDVFTSELRVMAARLSRSPHAGPCGDGCACGAIRSAPEQQEIACTLTSPEEVSVRIDGWQQLLAHCTSREGIDGGFRVRFSTGPTVAAEVARLAAAEVGCCSWIDFTVRVSPDATILEVRAPVAGQDVLASMFGDVDGATRVTVPRVATLLDRQGGDDECCDRVGPPEAESGVENESAE